MSLNAQPRLRLAALPTPLHLAERLTRALGGPRIYLKRDDLTGLALGGNKVRKLEYLVADALANGATHLITPGAAQSNHARQTAAAARVAGLRCALVLNAPDAAPELQGNLLLDHILGAAVHLVAAREQWQARMEEVAAELADSGAVPYLIPAGGSNGVGALGYVGAMLELGGQLWERGIAPAALYFAGSKGGGTLGGMALGAKLHGLDFPIIDVLVEGTAEEAVGRASRVAQAASDRLGIANPVRAADFVCDDGHVGAGYGLPTEEGLAAIALLARTEGVLLDPVYTAKAFSGLLADVRAGKYRPDEAIVFVHTGGVPALFAMAGAIAPALAHSPRDAAQG